MHTLQSIRRVEHIFTGRAIDLPDGPGVYAFWWMRPKVELMTANRHIVLAGPGKRPVDVEYRDWWPKELVHPCLYVGKTTNLRRRFGLHIMRDSVGRLHAPHPKNLKAKPRTTSCQLRFGIEHLFPNDTSPLDIIFRAVGFSYNTSFEDNAIAERFYEEDRLVGFFRPWFNIDSER